MNQKNLSIAIVVVAAFVIVIGLWLSGAGQTGPLSGDVAIPTAGPTPPKPVRTILTLEVTCNKGGDDTCSLSPTWEIELVGERGIAQDPEMFTAGIETLGNVEIYGGATQSGALVFQCAQGEGGLVLVYEELIGLDKVYLAVE